jgi:SAM-dependent methyltransferase
MTIELSKGAKPPSGSSAEYWQSLPGHAYREMIRQREVDGNRAYQQQETFLTALMTGLHRQLGRPLDVLEFGCGFGRHAAYLSSYPEVRYHGYDFSEKMLEPLRAEPPPSLVPVNERLFSGPSVGTAVGERKFDVVFTVSVLIHNPSEAVPALLQQMTDLLKPGGMLVLVENKVVPFSLYENEWHQGCWLHCYPDLTPSGWDLFIARETVDTHDIYVFRRSAIGAGRFFALKGPEAFDVAPVLSREKLDQFGLVKLRSWADQVNKAMSTPAKDSLAGTYDLREQLDTERELGAVRNRLTGIATRLAQSRAHQLKAAASALPGPQQASGKLTWNEPLDTKWAHEDGRFSRALHVFHAEWFGIRAAAGYLPGRKLSIPANRQLSSSEIQQIVHICHKDLARTVFVHGVSSNAMDLVRMLRSSLGDGVAVFGVWHGSTAQLQGPGEHQQFTRFLQLLNDGSFKGAGGVKPGLHRLDGRLFQLPLVNLPPRLSELPAGTNAHRGAALVPVPLDWRKNFYTNLIAADRSGHFRRTFVTAPFTRAPEISLATEIVSLLNPSRGELFRLITESDLILNATLSECHPMTALEGVAHRVPCLTGRLSLGELDQHPYQKLVQVDGVDSLDEVIAAIGRVMAQLRADPKGLHAMMGDFERILIHQALDRYAQFAGL